MRTTYQKIDKNPRCLKCGADAEYYFTRWGFFGGYRDAPLCFNCLKEHLSKIKVFLNRDKLIR